MIGIDPDYIPNLPKGDSDNLASDGDMLLSQAYPNPLNPSTNINFIFPETDHVVLTVYDFLGREVVTLVNSEKCAGLHTITWEGMDSSGKRIASGLYFYQIRYKDQIINRKMLLVK